MQEQFKNIFVVTLKENILNWLMKKQHAYKKIGVHFWEEIYTGFY